MATVIGNRTRGRKVGALRTTAKALAETLTLPGKPGNVTIELLPADGKVKAESITVELPKGAAVVPFGLTLDKSDENAREQIRKGAEDAGVAVSISSIMVRFDRADVGERAVWVLTKKGAEKK